VRGAKVFERNTFQDEYAWMGVLDLQGLVEETIAEDIFSTYDPMDFKANIDEWWPEFISDFCL
jgi:hypothetical protein